MVELFGSLISSLFLEIVLLIFQTIFGTVLAS